MPYADKQNYLISQTHGFIIEVCSSVSTVEMDGIYYTGHVSPKKCL